MHIRQAALRVEVLTPAKINLFLEVLARRPDGFHEIETLLAAISLQDGLVFVPLDEDRIELDCRSCLGSAACEIAQRAKSAEAAETAADVPCGPANLAWRAIALLRERAAERRGARLTLLKRIPAAAGLGGASSDAAAALVAANLGWNLGWSHKQLAELATEIGSDVPFFLQRGAAVCRGRGERIERVRLPPLPVVVVRPPVGLATPAVYQRCQPAEKPASVRPVIAALAIGDGSRAAKHLHNQLQQPAAALTPWIARLQAEFQQVDCLGHQMSGSGSSFFGICRHARHARRVASRLRARQVGAVYAATTAT